MIVDQEACGYQVINCPERDLGNDPDTLPFEKRVLFRVIEQPYLFELVIAVPRYVFGNVFGAAGIGLALVASENDTVLKKKKNPENFQQI